MIHMADDDDTLRRLGGEISELRARLSSIGSDADARRRRAVIQGVLSSKVGEREMILESRRVASVFKQHEEAHPIPTEDCPICLEPMEISDRDVQNFPCCGNALCGACALQNRMRGHFDRCPLCRATPPLGDREKMMRLIKDRAKGGKAWAQYQLGIGYMQGGTAQFDLPWKPSAAMKWLELAAEQDYPDALEELGEIHEKGRSCMAKQSLSKALSYYERAANLGDGLGMRCAGWLYLVGGDGIEVDSAKAMYYMTLAYVHDEDRNAAYALGKLFLIGEVGTQGQSLVRARHYLQIAAHKGCSEAYLPLAGCLQTLCSVEYDGHCYIPGHSIMPQVVYWIQKAAGLHDKEMTTRALEGHCYIPYWIQKAAGLHGKDMTTRALEDMTTRALEDIKQDAVCGNCGKADGLKSCAKCNAAWYCGRHCQRQHWNDGHRIDCKWRQRSPGGNRG